MTGYMVRTDKFPTYYVLLFILMIHVCPEFLKDFRSQSAPWQELWDGPRDFHPRTCFHFTRNCLIVLPFGVFLSFPPSFSLKQIPCTWQGSGMLALFVNVVIFFFEAFFFPSFFFSFLFVLLIRKRHCRGIPVECPPYDLYLTPQVRWTRPTRTASTL